MKRALLAAVMGALVPAGIFAQAAVIDVSAIAAAIENGYTLYKDLQTAYNTYQTAQQNLENAQKQAESIDWGNVKDWEDGLATVDDYMTCMDNIDSIINAKNMSIGGVSFSLNDLYTTDVYSRIALSSLDKVNPDEMTDQDKASFYSRHGMTAEHYYKMHAITEQLSSGLKKNKAKNSIITKISKKLLERSKKSGEEAKAANTQEATLQEGNKIAAQAGVTAAMQYDKTTEIADSVANKTAYDLEKDAELERQRQQLESVGTDVSSRTKKSVGDENSYLGPKKSK